MKGKERDQQLIRDLRTGGLAGEHALCQLYDMTRHMVISFVLKNNGNRDDGLDVLQESIVVAYDRIRSDQYTYQSKLSSYVYGIARFVWLRRLKRQKTETRIRDTQEYDGIEESPLEQILSDEENALIRSIFGHLDEDCRQVLMYVIYDNLSYAEILDKMHYQNEQVVRNKKYKCLKKLKEMISAHPVLIALLKDHGSY